MLVRAAVAKHLGRAEPSPALVPQSFAGSAMTMPPAAGAVAAIAAGPHPSHAVYLALVNTSDACVIEPSVPCNHCNYCRSHGH
jgi:hypothetical protein